MCCLAVAVTRRPFAGCLVRRAVWVTMGMETAGRCEPDGEYTKMSGLCHLRGRTLAIVGCRTSAAVFLIALACLARPSRAAPAPPGKAVVDAPVVRLRPPRSRFRFRPANTPARSRSTNCCPTRRTMRGRRRSPSKRPASPQSGSESSASTGLRRPRPGGATGCTRNSWSPRPRGATRSCRPLCRGLHRAAATQASDPENAFEEGSAGADGG